MCPRVGSCIHKNEDECAWELRGLYTEMTMYVHESEGVFTQE